MKALVNIAMIKQSIYENSPPMSQEKKANFFEKHVYLSLSAGLLKNK